LEIAKKETNTNRVANCINAYLKTVDEEKKNQLGVDFELDQKPESKRE